MAETVDPAVARAKLEAQLAELEARAAHVADDASLPANPDWEENAAEHQQDDALRGQEALIAQEIASVRRALGRIVDGSYGECVRCGEAIAPARLTARPEAALCIDCARKEG
jgi:DnaK suppressor protein